LKAQLEQREGSLQEAKDCQKALEDSLSVAEKNLECLRQDISRLQHSHRRSETAVAHYRSKAKLLSTSLGEVIDAVKRVEGQQNKKLPEPPKMI
jgi:predicted  nucleic acid-binding Zn-ribbon protein